MWRRLPSDGGDPRAGRRRARSRCHPKAFTDDDSLDLGGENGGHRATERLEVLGRHSVDEDLAYGLHVAGGGFDELRHPRFGERGEDSAPVGAGAFPRDEMLGFEPADSVGKARAGLVLSLIPISEPTRLGMIS